MGMRHGKNGARDAIVADICAKAGFLPMGPPKFRRSLSEKCLYT